MELIEEKSGKRVVKNKNGGNEKKLKKANVQNSQIGIPLLPEQCEVPYQFISIRFNSLAHARNQLRAFKK
jgi:hypothetical protein